MATGAPVGACHGVEAGGEKAATPGCPGQSAVTKHELNLTVSGDVMSDSGQLVKVKV